MYIFSVASNCFSFAIGHDQLHILQADSSLQKALDGVQDDRLKHTAANIADKIRAKQ